MALQALRIFQRPLLGVAVALCFAAPGARANPSGPTVANGAASFAASGSKLTVTNTPGAIINWQQFSIQANEVTRFVQQNAASAVLNRVLGGNPSAILGTLSSNGRVYLINASGITIGAGARIDVAGFAASTLGLSDADFIAGRNRFAGTGQEGALSNAGRITTPEGGFVYLVAPKVENGKDAVITSPGGTVTIAAGRTVELVNSREPDVRVEYTAGGEAVNAGAIVAASGSVGIYGTLVRSSGLVSASRAVAGDGGSIVFKSAGDTLLEAGSRTEAVGDKGGSVQVLGDHVGVLDGASIDASGDAAGGTVLVGGDLHGANAAVQNATRTYFGAGATIRADGGGKVVVWSDDITRAYGTISAKGGFVEVSGANLLDFAARVDAATILLDPQDITIQNTGGASNAQVGGADTSILFADGTPPANTNYTLNDETLEALTGNIVLQAQRDLTINAGLSGGGLVLTNAGQGITLQAGRNITIGSPIVTQGGAIQLEADSPSSPSGAANGAGTLSINANITSNGGHVTLIAGGNSITGGGGITFGSTGSMVNAGAGGINLALSGNAALGIGSLGIVTQILGNPSIAGGDGSLANLRTTGALVIGTATTAGGATLTASAITNEVANSAISLSGSSGSSVSLVAGAGGITIDQPLTSFQNTTIDTTGVFRLSAPLNTNNNTLSILNASSVNTAGGSITTGSAAIVCTAGAGCPTGSITGNVNLWSLAGSGDWMTGANWSLGHVPTSNEVALIGPNASPYTISLGSSAQGSALSQSIGLLVNDQVLDLTGNATVPVFSTTLGISSSINYNGSTASLNAGTLNLSNAVLAGTGVLENRGLLNVANSTLSASVNQTSGGVLNANGTNLVSGGLTSAAGTAVNVLSGTTTVSGATGNGNYFGTVSISSGAQLALTGGTQNLIGGSLLGTGTLLIDGATVAFDPASVYNVATTNLASGSLEVDNSSSFATLNLSGGTIDGIGSLVVADYHRTGGTLGTPDCLSGCLKSVDLASANAIALDALAVSDSIRAVSTGGAIVLNGTLMAGGSGDSIVLAGTSFTNNAGATALDPLAGRFLVWSGTPVVDNRGGLAYDFKQYGATYGSSAVLGSGNGFLYTAAPTVTAGLTGTVSKVYDSTAAAALAPGDFTVSGAIDGDTVVLNNPASGTYADKNVGTGKQVDVSGILIASASNGAASVYGYQLASSTASGNVGEITPATLTYVADPASRNYGELNPALTGQVTGFVASESLATATSGSLLWTTPADTTSVAGSYEVAGGGLAAANYVFAQAPGNLLALTVLGVPPLPKSLVTPPPLPAPASTALPTASLGTTLLNLDTGQNISLPPNTVPDPGIYLSQDSGSVLVVGESQVGAALNSASTLLFPVSTYDPGLYVNSQTGFLYEVTDGAVLDPGVYYNRDTQTVLVVSSNHDGNVTVQSADIKDAVTTVATGAGTRHVAGVTCK
ncbi:MAG: beta strand repeat-containing protein [Burkholderiales bacterium]